MGIRETINKKSGLFIGTSITLIVVAGGFAVMQVHGHRSPLPKYATQSFYTTDDGTTLFADSVSSIPPFDHNGTTAVRAHVFSCDGGKHQWVQYLEKYTPEGIKSAEAFQNGTAGPSTPNLLNGIIVKRPGATDWVHKNGAAAIIIPTPPDGMSGGKITEVYP